MTENKNSFLFGFVVSGSVFTLLLVFILRDFLGLVDVSNWLIAIFTGISAIAIVLTAWSAQQSFWLTDDSEKTRRSLELIQKMNSTEAKLGFMLFFNHDPKEIKECLQKNLFLETEYWGSKNVRVVVNTYFSILEQIGLLVRLDKVQEDILFGYLITIFHDVKSNILIIARYLQAETGDDRNYENLIYLYEKLPS